LNFQAFSSFSAFALAYCSSYSGVGSSTFGAFLPAAGFLAAAAAAAAASASAISSGDNYF